jgi:hypothetical protein
MVDYLFAFPHRYQADLLDELPGGNAIPTFYFPGVSQKGGPDGLLVSIRPNEAQPWLGIFAFGGYGPITVLSSTPDPDILLVVSRGAGYYIRADDPKAWTGIMITSIGATYIEGEAWDPTMKEPPMFRVNLNTGEHEGGSSPEMYAV